MRYRLKQGAAIERANNFSGLPKDKWRNLNAGEDVELTTAEHEQIKEKLVPARVSKEVNNGD